MLRRPLRGDWITRESVIAPSVDALGTVRSRGCVGSVWRELPPPSFTHEVSRCIVDNDSVRTALIVLAACGPTTTTAPPPATPVKQPVIAPHAAGKRGERGVVDLIAVLAPVEGGPVSW